MLTEIRVDFDDDDQTIRLWSGAVVVGELRPAGHMTRNGDAKWNGWLTGDLMTGLLGRKIEIVVPQDRDGR